MTTGSDNSVFAGPKVLFRIVEEKKKFVIDLAEDEANIWQHSTWEEQGIKVELYHVDTAEWLAAEFGNPKYADNLLWEQQCAQRTAIELGAVLQTTTSGLGIMLLCM